MSSKSLLLRLSFWIPVGSPLPFRQWCPFAVGLLFRILIAFHAKLPTPLQAT